MSGGAPKKSVQGTRLPYTEEQINVIWKEATADREVWEDDMLDQWDERWSSCRDSASNLLEAVAQYNVCVSSIEAKMRSNALTTGQVHARIAAWFKADEAKINADHRSVIEFMEKLGRTMTEEQALSRVPAEDRKAIQDRETQWKILMGSHMNIDSLMSLTCREEKRNLRSQAKKVDDEVYSLRLELTKAIGEVYKGMDIQIIEAPLKAVEDRIMWVRGNVDAKVQNCMIMKGEDSCRDAIDRAREELAKITRQDVMTVGELAQKEMAKKQHDREVRDRQIKQDEFHSVERKVKDDRLREAEDKAMEEKAREAEAKERA